jgi:hypothetical protein
MVLFILAGTAFLAVFALTVFTVLVVSIRRAERAPLSEIQGKQAGITARRVLTGFRFDSEEDAE